MNFTHESLTKALIRLSYDPQVPSFFSWLGVTYYLTREALFTTLRTITDIVPRGSTVILDYLDNDAFVPGRAAKRAKIAMEHAQNQGEPIITGFDSSTLADALALPLCLCLHENLSPIDIEERYFQGRRDGYHAYEHMRFAWIVVE